MNKVQWEERKGRVMEIKEAVSPVPLHSTNTSAVGALTLYMGVRNRPYRMHASRHKNACHVKKAGFPTDAKYGMQCKCTI